MNTVHIRMNFDMPASQTETVPAGHKTAASAAKSTPTARGVLPQLRQWIWVLFLAGVCYFAISRFLLQTVKVVGVSMMPTLQNSQRYFLNRWVYVFRSPKTSDVVVLRDPADNGFSVKRIVAGAGDLVCLRQGHVYVNGRKLDEPYLAPGTLTFSFGKSIVMNQSVVCGADQYFVLGDNRGNSVDSRAYGPVPKANILGMIVR
jgi:signal peptidase I